MFIYDKNVTEQKLLKFRYARMSIDLCPSDNTACTEFDNYIQYIFLNQIYLNAWIIPCRLVNSDSFTQH